MVSDMAADPPAAPSGDSTSDPARSPTLDPDSPEAWEAFRALAHRAVDDLVEHWQRRARGEGPVWQPISPESRRALEKTPLPLDGQDAEATYQEFLDHVLPFDLGNAHPRFWGWVIGTGTPLGALADFLAAGLNPNVGGFEQGATRVELQVIRWLDQALGFDAGAEGSGLLVSGASVANLVALTVARSVGAERAGLEVRDAGLQKLGETEPTDPTGKPTEKLTGSFTVHGSREAHSSVIRALDLLGLGREAFRAAPTRRDLSVDPTALVHAIAEDRAAGHHPIAVVAHAGTVRTGAMDDLEALADLAETEGLWLHVDGAFGALAALSSKLRPRLGGLQRADSLAFDLHKWGNLPYGAGCVLVRDGQTHRAAFRQTADYLAALSAGPAAPGSPNFGDLGPELSRPFRALKVWMALKTHGVRELARTVERNVEQAHLLARRIAEEPKLRLVAPRSLAPRDLDKALNIVCFRYAPPELGQSVQNRINQRLLGDLHEDGVAVPSAVTLHGHFCLRVALVNHRTRDEDLELLVREVVRRGDELATSRLATGC